MSQVRKYQQGGTTPEDKKKETVVVETPTEPIKPVVPGLEEIILKEKATPETEPTIQKPTSYIILDGEKFENNEENRKKVAQYFAKVADPNGGSAMLNQIKDLIYEASQNGYTINYDTPGNRFSYIDPQGQSHFIDWRHLNDRQDKRIQRERSWLGKFLDSAFNTKVQQAAEDVYKMRGLASALRGDTTTETAAVDPDLINIDWGNNTFFNYLRDPETNDYLKDENGNLKYDKNSASNQRAMQILNRARRYLGLTTDDERKQFKFSDKWTQEAQDALKGIYNSDPDAWNANYDNIINKITTGQKLSAEDISWLKLFGFDPNGTEKTAEEKAQEAADLAKTKWTNAGYGDLYEKGKDWLDLGDDNILTLNEVGKSALKDYLLDSAGNEFNNDWINWLKDPSRNADVTAYDWLNGYTLYNGRLYKTDSGRDPNSALGKIYVTSGFIDKNRANKYGEAQKIINTFWGNPYEWSTADDSMYSGFTWDPTANNGAGGYRTDRYFRNETGRYSGIGTNQQLVSYYDPSAERDYRGMWTDAGQRFAITDEWGDVIADNLTAEDLKRRGIAKILDSAGNEIPYDPNRKFHQKALYKSSDRRINNHFGIFYGDEDQIGIYFNPMKSPNSSDPDSHVLFKAPGLDAAYVVPATLAKKLLEKDANGTRGIEKIIANARFQEILNNILIKIGQGNIWSGGDANQTKLAKALGMNETEEQQFKDECKRMSDDERVNRRTKWKVSIDAINAGKPKEQIPSQKQGGVIRKFAPGGGFAKASGSSASTSQTKTKVKDVRKSEEMSHPFNFDWNKLTSADKADIVGLAADVLAIAAGSAPIAGGVAGLVGTGAGLYADIKRDGFQLRDAGNAALSGGMDVVSMIPGLGSGVQAAKVAAKIATKAKPIIHFLTAIGVASAVPIVEKIAKGEKPTIQEWRVLANGFAAGINTAKLGRPFASATKKGDFKNIDITAKGQQEVGAFNIKPKSGEDLPEINLTKEQVAEINATTDPGLKKQKIARYVQTALQGDTRTAGKPIKDYLEKYNLDSFTESATSPADGITVKSRVRGEDDIVLTKSDVDEINAQPDAASKMAKAREKIAYYRGLAKPTASAAENAAAASKYNLGNLWTVKSNLTLNGKIKVNRPDITLDKTDIETISGKTTPAEQEKAFVEIVKTKSGDTTLDSVDKIKEAFKVDDFFEKKRGSWEWKHPIDSIKGKFQKKDTFTLKAERVEEPRPVRGNNKLGIGFRDWWNGVGTYRNNGTNRSDLFNPKSAESTTPTPAVTPASPTSGTSGGTRTGANWWQGVKRVFTPNPKNQRGILVMQPGNQPWLRIHDYAVEEAPGVIEDESYDNTGMTGAYTYKTGGKIIKAAGGATTPDIASGLGHMDQNWKQKLGTALTYASPMIGEFTNLALSISGNNKVEKILKNALKNPPMVIAPQYNIPRFNDNGVLNDGRQLVKDIYNRQPANYTSDAMLNNFVRKATQEKATEYQNKVNNLFSQQLAQHNAKMDEIRNKNLNNFIESANQNNKTRYTYPNAVGNVEAGTVAGNRQSLKNFNQLGIKELTQQLTNARAMKSQFANSRMLNWLNTQPDYVNARTAYKKYAAANPTGLGFEQWLDTEGVTYKPAYVDIVQKANRSFIGDRLDAENLGIFRSNVNSYINKALGNQVAYNKSGGKISNSNYKAYRDYKEQIAIDSNKEIRKAILQLNKNCQQLLLKMLK